MKKDKEKVDMTADPDPLPVFTNDKDRQKALEAVSAELAKQFKRPILVSASTITLHRMPTGLCSTDDLTCGGLPRGRFSMYFGANGCGKTTLAFHNIRTVQEAGGIAAYIDAEHAFDPAYARELGINCDTLLISQPGNLEEGATTLMKLAPICDTVVYDSIVAVAPKAEQARELDKETMALIARKLSQFFRIVTPIVGKSQAAIVLINQVRVDLGAFIPIERYPGGHALAHECSYIMHMRRGAKDDNPKELVDGKEIQTGIRIHLRVDKTKVGPNEGARGFFDIHFKSPHLDEYTDVLAIAQLKGIVTKGGAWYYYGDKKFQGEDKFLDALHNNMELFFALKDQVLKKESDTTLGETTNGSGKTTSEEK